MNRYLLRSDVATKTVRADPEGAEALIAECSICGWERDVYAVVEGLPVCGKCSAAGGESCMRCSEPISDERANASRFCELCQPEVDDMDRRDFERAHAPDPVD